MSKLVSDESRHNLMLRCKDLGIECPFIAHGTTDDEVLKQAADHARVTHQIFEIDEECLKVWRSAIHAEPNAKK